MNPKRLELFKSVVSRRQSNLTVILEDVHDSHNVGAILRTCDSVGIQEVYVLESNHLKQRIVLGKKSSAGSRKWVTVHFFTDQKACFKAVRAKYDSIWCTHLGTESKTIHAMDFTGSIALLFGNEHSGVSKESLADCDGNFLIPQAGMSKSLNVSVACAITLYEAYRQRMEKGFYDTHPPLSEVEQADLLERYLAQHKSGLNNRLIWKREE